MAYISVDIESGCWLWTGYVAADGYGQISRGGTGGRPIPAHRAAYEVLVEPIPEGLTLDHLCRVRHCVNPDHLEPVTNRENILRGDGFAAENVLKTHCPKGHAYDEANTYYFDKGRSRGCRTCRREATRQWRQRNLAKRAAYAREYRRRQKKAVA